jgi:hypothetical protein
LPVDRRAYQRAYAEAHREQARKRSAEWRAANPDRARAKVRELWSDPERRQQYNARKREYAKTWAQTDAFKASQAKWRDANREKIAEKGRRWRELRKDLNCAKSAKRRAAMRCRVPAWVTDDDVSKIKAVYSRAADLTRQTGIDHHVDHIFPLLGRTVSGLHVPENLQVLTATENYRKRNLQLTDS